MSESLKRKREGLTKSEDLENRQDRVTLAVGASGNITFSEHDEEEKFD